VKVVSLIVSLLAYSAAAREVDTKSVVCVSLGRAPASPAGRRLSFANPLHLLIKITFPIGHKVGNVRMPVAAFQLPQAIDHAQMRALTCACVLSSLLLLFMPSACPFFWCSCALRMLNTYSCLRLPLLVLVCSVHAQHLPMSLTFSPPCVAVLCSRSALANVSYLHCKRKLVNLPFFWCIIFTNHL